jgi:hypothetical protein
LKLQPKTPAKDKIPGIMTRGIYKINNMGDSDSDNSINGPLIGEVSSTNILPINPRIIKIIPSRFLLFIFSIN